MIVEQQEEYKEQQRPCSMTGVCTKIDATLFYYNMSVPIIRLSSGLFKAIKFIVEILPTKRVIKAASESRVYVYCDVTVCTCEKEIVNCAAERRWMMS